MKKFYAVVVLLASFLFGGCASNYHAINPPSVAFPSSRSVNGIDFTYKYDLLRTYGNNKYAKKEDKKGVRVVAVEITNNTGRDLIFPADFQLVSGDRQVQLLDPVSVHQQLKQGVPIYLLYLLFTPMNLYTHDESGVTSTTRIGLFLGPGLTALNIGIAASANNSFKEELLLYDLNNLEIRDGDTVVGLIGIPDTGFSPLELRVR